MIWLAAVALLLILAVVLRLSLLFYVAYALVGIWLLSRYLTRVWAESLVASREYNKLTAEIGEQIAVVVTIENRGRLPIPWLLVEDLLPADALLFEPPKLAVSGSRMRLLMLRGGGRKTLLYQLTCNRRGYFQLGPLVLETGDLFGLHRRFRVLTDPHYLLVMPKVMPLSGYEIASRRPIGEVKLTYRLYEDPTRIAGVREYQRGDSLNRVHWKATARTGVLHSKVYEPSTVAGTTLLLDFHQSSYERRHEPMRSDLAVTAAASIANAVFLMGQQVGLVTNGRDAADRIRQEGWRGDWRTREAARGAVSMQSASSRLAPVVVPTRRGPEQLLQIHETLARLELTDGLSLEQLVHEATSRLPRDATVIAILPRVTAENAIALGNLRRRGLAVEALLNLWDDYDFAQASGPLLAQGIATRHLKDEAGLMELCRRQVLG
jgi:uncharacterized protein (DUF58 family)